ncbi:hypothetical protein MMB17_05555 [Methylobacterium organophilum]|uniref:hypothetical protein n=1 Tax=Methylobacterium organophilum TaxID=410 RepID=UPI001F13FBDE|nr:hypothetical protein [Methylobacterium organophilum]UMY18782.1 hypothetical protein MMB17_05555 [Methylobacterium organophilum]
MDAETAVAALLAVNVYAVEHDELAGILAPLVGALPPPRDWSEDDEWTASEEAQAAARRFVETHGAKDRERDPWLALEERRRRLGDMQLRHREVTVVAALGELPGYKAFARAWYDDVGGPRVSLWRVADSADLTLPLLTLAAGTTRREAQIAIAAWEAGYQRGKREGVAGIRRGVRELLLPEDDTADHEYENHILPSRAYEL